MNLIFTVLALLGLGYFLFVPRVFDWFSVGYVSSCIYMTPAFVGISVGGYYEETPMCAEAYLACGVVLFAILLGAFLTDTIRTAPPVPVRNRPLEGPIAFVLTAINLLGLIQTWRTGGEDLWSSNKQEVLQVLTVWCLIWQMGSVSGTVFSYASARPRLMLVNLLSLCFLWFLGFRSSMVLTALAIFVIWASGRGRRPLVGNWKLGVCGMTMLAFVLCYKQVYIFVKSGRWDAVVAVVSQDGFLSESLLKSEAMTQTHLLNIVLIEDYRIPFWEHWQATLVESLLPGVGKSGDVSYGGWLTAELFTDVPWGIASNIWAEMYSAGGWLLLFAFAAAYACVLRGASMVIRRGSTLAICVTCAWMPNWAFYIHRNDTYRMLSFLKQYGLVLALCGVGVVLLQMLGLGGLRRGTVPAPGVGEAAAVPGERRAGLESPRRRAA
ncbi:MAG: hypothetical protein KF774_15290 [Planctomyces sp.]|nr:hypothetical protein [Planctomyces sp.]